MEEDLFTKYLRDACSRGSVQELYAMYEASLSLGSVGVKIRKVIESGVRELVSFLGYPKDLVSFRQVVEFWKGMEKLDRMVVSNGLLLITRSQRIPLRKSLFFCLLKHRKDIRGVRVVFDVTRTEFEDNYSFSCIDEGYRVVTTLFEKESIYNYGCDILGSSGSAVYSDYSNTPSDIDHFFDENAEIPTILESNNYRIYIGLVDEEMDPVHMLESIKEGRKGFVVFGGFQENGDYSVVKDGIQTYLPSKICSLKNNKANVILTVLRYAQKYQVEQFYYCFDFSCVLREDLPEELKLSYLIYLTRRYNMSNFKYIDFFKSPTFPFYQCGQGMNYVNCCYFQQDSPICLYSIEKVMSDVVILRNGMQCELGKEYIFEGGYGYELIL